MLNTNKYLRELGYNNLKNQEEKFDNEDFYNLDLTLDMIIYSYLSYFREHFANTGIPCSFETQEDWINTLDKILSGLRLALNCDKILNEQEEQEVEKARHLLADIWPCLWV